MRFLRLVFFLLFILLSGLVLADDEMVSVSFLGEAPPPKFTTGTMISKDLDKALGVAMGLFQLTEKLPYYYYISYGDVVDFYDWIKVSIKVEGVIANYINNGYEPLIISLYEQGGGEAGMLIFDSDEARLDKEKATISAHFTPANFSINGHTDGENKAIFVLTFFKEIE
jgi:hypothetical protein